MELCQVNLCMSENKLLCIVKLEGFWQNNSVQIDNDSGTRVCLFKSLCHWCNTFISGWPTLSYVKPYCSKFKNMNNWPIAFISGLGPGFDTGLNNAGVLKEFVGTFLPVFVINFFFHIYSQD